MSEMSLREGRRMLGALTRKHLGISVDEFLRRLDAGRYRGQEDDQIVKMVMLAPFARGKR